MVEVAEPYKTILPEPMIFPWTANCSDGLVVAMPTLPNASTTKEGVVVPTVKRPDKVVVPMPIFGPAPESTKNAGIISVELVAVLVPKAMSPQTSSR